MTKKKTELQSHQALTPGLFLRPLNSQILAFADSEHFGATSRTNTLRCRFAILHFDCFWILHLLLCAAFHTISLHNESTSLFLR